MGAVVSDRGGDGPRVRTRAPFVGRGPELAELSEALTAAIDGHGSLCMISGESGIGKTRLAEAVAEEAAQRQMAVLWGSAWEAGGAPAYWPWTQVVRTLLHSRTGEQIREYLGPGAPYVAQIAPEVSDKVGAVEPALARDTPAARFSAFDATSSFLRAAAERRPLLIVLDDLHAADVATLRLLEFLARGLHGARILAIGTHRAGDVRCSADVTAALADLSKTAGRIKLGGLARDEVAEVATARSPTLPSAGLVEHLHALTEGNPLFLDEVMRLLSAEGALGARAPGRLPLPDGVQETIRRRLDPLDPPSLRTLTDAAVIGPEFRLETLARVAAGERSELLERLDVAAAARLIVEVPGAVGHYRFAHALVRETLYEGLGARERATRHAAVGQALLDLHGEGPGAPMSELAHHFVEAAPVGNSEPAARFATRAGEDAMQALAYEQAIDFFDDALRALGFESVDPDRRGAILLARGNAEISAGRLEAGRMTLATAADLAREVGDSERLGRVALASAPWGLATGLSHEAVLVPLLREALDSLPDADSALRARLLARLAAAVYWSEDADVRRDLVERAIAMARRVGDDATLALVLSDAHRATWDPDSPQRALPWASEIYALAEAVGDMELALIAHSWRISLLLELGDLAMVDHEIETFARTAGRLHQPRGQVGVHVHACARALIAGRYEEAEGALGRAAEFAELLAQDQVLGMRLAALAFVMRYAQGRLGELELAVRQFADAQPAMPVWRCGLVCVYQQTDRDADVRREYEALSADDFATLPRDNLWLPSMAFLAEACAHLEDRDGARTLGALLAPYSGRNVVTPDVAYVGPVDRYLAMVAAAAGEQEQAAAYFASAVELAGKMDARPMSAQLALDEAEVMRERDPARSAALAAEAAAEGEALGLERMVRRARELAGDAVHVAPPAPATAPRAGRLRRRGDVWEVTWGGAPFHVKDAKGMHYLVRLLAQPGHELHALDLAGGISAPTPPSAGIDPELSVRSRGGDDAGPLLDTRAKAEYRRRIDDLREEIEEAETYNDLERASRAREELEFVAHELSAAVGLGGRDRRAAATSERARVNVTRALRATVDRIGGHDAALGHHLRTCVRTGTFCVYEPGPGAPPWDVDPTS
jgi:tetratricopeptide (TPR) repeat protein